MATEQTQPDEELLHLRYMVSELSILYAYALTEYDIVQAHANCRAVNQMRAVWQRAVDELKNYQID